MLFLWIAIFPAVLAVLFYAIYRVFKNDGVETAYDAGASVFTVIAIIIVALGFLVSSGSWYAQIDDFENIKKFEKIEAINRTKAEALTAEFTRHLAETYPKHEKDIFGKISPEQAALYLVKYPELKASETLMNLVERINELQSAVYDQRVATEEALQSTRVRLRNPWLFTFMIPKE